MTAPTPTTMLVQMPGPAGTFEPQLTDRADFDVVAERSRELGRLLADRGVAFHRDSTLGVLLRDAERYAVDRAAGKSDMAMRQFVNAMHAYRLAQAILPTQFDEDVEQCLRRIAGNDVNLSLRQQSMGKDHLWELELLVFLRRRGMKVRLQDPPDLMLALGGADYPIACKKIYSEKGVQGQMQKGARQLAKLGLGGVVAFNVDDLIAEDCILNSRSRQEAGDILATLNAQFILRHQGSIATYVADGRCDGALVSATSLVDVETASPRFVNFTEVALWSPPEATPAAQARIAELSRMLSQPSTRVQALPFA